MVQDRIRSKVVDGYNIVSVSQGIQTIVQLQEDAVQCF